MWMAVCDDEQGFVIKIRNDTVRIAFAQIEYVEVINKTVFFHLADSTVWEVNAALANFERKLLARPEFLKIHRSYLVNLRYVQAVSGESVRTSNGNIIPVARQRRSQVQEAYMRFLLPREKEPAKGHEKAERADGPWHILLVDDEPQERALWADILRSHGCTVRLVANGEEACAHAADESYDCVLLDVMLSGEDGFSLCDKLRRLGRAPVIFLSCLTEINKQVKGFAAGGVDYITKDTPAELFWAKVEARIRQERSDITRFRYGPLLLDLSERKAFIDEKDLRLPPVEFDLLQLLTERAGHIFTPEELFKAVWGRAPQDGGQIAQTHMSRLRRKLEKAWAGHHFIETIWGEGYRFVFPER